MLKKKFLMGLIIIPMVICVLTGCGSKDLELQNGITISASNTSTSAPFTVLITTPTKVVDNEEKVSTYEATNEVTEVIFTGEKLIIDVKKSSYAYNSYTDYTKKYGDKEANYTNYLEYLNDHDFDSHKTTGEKNYELTTIAGFDAIKEEYNNTYIYILNNEKFYSTSRFTVTLKTVNTEDKIADVVSDEEVKSVIDSIVINGYIED